MRAAAAAERADARPHAGPLFHGPRLPRPGITCGKIKSIVVKAYYQL